MHLNVPLTAATFAILTCSAVGVSMQGSRYLRDLRWAAECGVDPHLVLSDTESFHYMLSNPATEKTGPSPELVSIPIDHNDPSVGTYQNRFWVTEEFYVPGSPIFVFDGGESNAEVYKSHLTSNQSFFWQMLKDFKGMGILWEHRYYGESRPFPVSLSTPPEHLQYLTTRQALEDIPYFAKNFSRPSHPDMDLRPQSTPWIMVGGSYAGIRTALTRNEYPDTIYAAYASSAPVEAQVDMSIYFDNVYRGMEANGLGDCIQSIQAAYQYIDGELEQHDTAAAVKKLFFGPGAENNTNEGFTAALTHLYDSFQGYGVSGPTNSSLQDFCDHMKSAGKMNWTARATHSLSRGDSGKDAAERWASWPPLLSIVNYNYATNCKQQNETIPLSCDFEQPTTDPDLLAWSWQYCTEWGYFQSNNFGPHALLSKYQTLEYQQLICNREFPEAVKKGMLPSQPRADATNAEFGGWGIRPSNTFFTVGEFDPWTTLSVLSQAALTAEHSTWSEDIPECGAAKVDHLFGKMLTNSEHCFDFQPPRSQGAFSLFEDALRNWLTCFNAGQGSNTRMAAE